MSLVQVRVRECWGVNGLNRARDGLFDYHSRPRNLPQHPIRKGEKCFRQRDRVYSEADYNLGGSLGVTQSQRLFEVGFCFGEIALLARISTDRN